MNDIFEAATTESIEEPAVEVTTDRQEELNKMAEDAGVTLDRRKSLDNQMKDITSHFAARNKELEDKQAAADAEKAAREVNPQTWSYKPGYRFHVEGPKDSGGIYIKTIKTGLEFFCPKDEIKDYLAG